VMREPRRSSSRGEMRPRRRGRTWEPQACVDCGVDTLNMDGRCEAYLVRNDVWRAAGMNGSSRRIPPGEFRICAEGEPRLFDLPPVSVAGEFLCVGCIEQRLGRWLTQADFRDTPAGNPFNHSDPAVNTQRLESRLAAS
jgi:hypothetical protein